MKAKIQSRIHLESVLYTCIDKYDNCVIELKCENTGESLYITSIELPNDTVLLSLSTNKIDRAIGNAINKNDGRSKMAWIKEKCEFIDFSDNPDFTLYMPEQQELSHNKLDYKKSYLKSQEEVKKSIPLKIVNLDDAMDLFCKFLKNNNCNKLIYSFNVIIKDLKYKFTLNLIIDKLYVFSKSLITFVFERERAKDASFMILLPDGEIQHNVPRVDLFELDPIDGDNILDMLNFCEMGLLGAFDRCCNVSEEEVELYVYSNCELI